MYMVTTVLNLIIQILLLGWKLISYIQKYEFDTSVIAQCTDDWYFQDSSVTMLLACFMISMPIQQFTSCFYVIPMEHKFFEASKAMQEGKECAHVDDVEIEMKDEPKKKAGEADDNPE